MRGESYGINDFEDNGDGTITDKATGLMWERDGSAEGMNWEEALARAQDKNAETHLGHDDWRLPDAKELQSLLDYERSPSYTNSAAISPLFNVPVITDEAGNDDYPFYWTSTTHYDGPEPNKAVYICFGKALGYMFGEWIDVHGAGAQRSDPKTGDPANYPEGHGPQGDAIRIFNFVRLVRDTEISSGTLRGDYNEDGSLEMADVIKLLLLGNDNPSDTALDFNGDGGFSIADAISLLLYIRDNSLG